ncbi:MAG: FitA-like ribbon-helix-helix domain-containing protein [Thermoanaerobaculia bacterium]
MSGTMIQIRSVPEDLHRQLKARAALEGMSMSDYVLREITKSLERPMRNEILSKLRAQPVRKLRKRPADVIRDGRESR